MISQTITLPSRWGSDSSPGGKLSNVLFVLRMWSVVRELSAATNLKIIKVLLNNDKTSIKQNLKVGDSLEQITTTVAFNVIIISHNTDEVALRKYVTDVYNSCTNWPELCMYHRVITNDQCLQVCQTAHLWWHCF